MHIKQSPIEGIKQEFIGFELDASKVELHSSDKQEIRLPYSGPLPDGLQDNNGAFLSVCINVGLMVCVSLIVIEGNKEHRFSVEATTQEKNDLLFPFFFEDKGSNTFHLNPVNFDRVEILSLTRWDCGLTHYWLGHHQDAYTHWRRLVYEGHNMDGLINQLDPKALKQVVLYIGEYGKTA